MAKTICYEEYCGVEEKNADFLLFVIVSVLVLSVAVILVINNTYVIGPEFMNNPDGVGLY